jgi:hypothetical protein
MDWRVAREKVGCSITVRTKNIIEKMIDVGKIIIIGSQSISVVRSSRLDQKLLKYYVPLTLYAK